MRDRPPEPPQPLAFLPVPRGPDGPADLTLSAGSVWIDATLLAPGVPSNRVVGVRITSGTAALKGQAVVVAGVIHIGTDDVLTLTLDLDPPAADTDPNPDPGLDGRLTVAALPSPLIVVFAAAGARITYDAIGATVYGTTVNLTGNGQAARFDGVLNAVVVPASAAQSSFTVGQAHSTLLAPAGTAAITGGGWAVPVFGRDLSAPGDADTAGFVTVTLDGGLTAQGLALGSTVAVTAGTLASATGTLGLSLTLSGPPLKRTFTLWQERPGRSSTVDFTLPKGATVVSLATDHQEMFAARNGSVAGHLDRPQAADGSRLPLGGAGALILEFGPATALVEIMADLVAPEPDAQTALAIENAFLLCSPARTLTLQGTLNGQSVTSGQAAVTLSLNLILPTLPDPYVARFSEESFQGLPATLTATTKWSDPASPILGFSSSALSTSESTTTTGIVSSVSVALLDVSGRADQLGVAIFGVTSAPAALDMDGMRLRTDGSNVLVFTVPEISWEPMFNDVSAQSPPPSVDDGGPATFTVPSVQFVPVVPGVVLDTFLADAGVGNAWTADVTLPFGLRAQLANEPGTSVTLTSPAFDGSLSGGRQITFLPANPSSLDASFPGSAQTVDGQNQYGSLVLGTNVPPGNSNLALLFNQAFTQRAPLRRYDMSGYGASVFSDWRNQHAGISDIVKVQFDVFVGRAAYEVVEEQNVIYPWGVRIVRTVTIERKVLGGVIRHDSGWRAASDGRFDPPLGGNTVVGLAIHPGACDRITAVRNIQPVGAPFPAGAQQWQAVTFDADVVFAPDVVVTDGTGGSTTVVCRGMTGYLLENLVTTPPDAGDVRTLLDDHPATGPLACTVTISATNAKLRATLLHVAQVIAFTPPAGNIVHTVVELRGVPVLPADGSWSVGKRPTASTEPPAPLDPNFPVPLIRNVSDPTWHFTDASEITRLDAPAIEYGWLQTTGTQKVFFGRPQLVPNQPSFQLPTPPHLADVAALFNASGLFPDLGAALDFDQPTNLAVSDGGVEIHRDFTLDPSIGPRPLVDFGAVKVLIDYEIVDDDNNVTPAHAFVDIAPGTWQIRVENVTFPVITPLSSDPKKPLLRITGNLRAASGSTPTLDKLDVKYGGMLAPVESIFCNLQQLAQFLPGAAGPKLDVSFSNGKLSILDVFTLPKLPLGVGFITDIALNIGMTMQLLPPSLDFAVSIGREQKPFHWLVSPLSGTGVVQVGVKDGDLAVLIQAGIGAGLSIDLGIASGSASIVIAFQAEISGAQVLLKALLTGQASVDVLDGAASASLTLTAGLGFSPNPTIPRLPSTRPFDDVTLVASVAVSIHISVCWVLHVDFDDFWQFRQTVDVPDITSAIPF